jgi:hypothetical protein
MMAMFANCKMIHAKIDGSAFILSRFDTCDMTHVKMALACWNETAVSFTVLADTILTAKNEYPEYISMDAQTSLKFQDVHYINGSGPFARFNSKGELNYEEK